MKPKLVQTMPQIRKQTVNVDKYKVLTKLSDLANLFCDEIDEN